MPVIECVPNVSEGRRAEVVQALVDAVRSVPGVRLLDCSSDPSHNRSVLTMVGEAASLKAAILGLFDEATARIDLRLLGDGRYERVNRWLRTAQAA